MRLPGWIFIACGLGFASVPMAGIEGRVRIFEKGGELLPESESKLVAIWFESGQRQVRANPLALEIRTRRKQFEPRLVIVPVGSTVRFPNADPILHNVFSVHPQNRFDLGLYGSGEGKEVRFQHPGIVAVFCNVHHAMFAHVVVVGTPHFGQPNSTGTFRLEGLPTGKGVLKVWHERSEVWERELDSQSGGIEVRLELTRPKVPPHLNKHGRSYGGSRYGG